MPRILIITGETSGDLHGANLASALRQLCPDIQLLGVGGPQMQAAGVKILQGFVRVDAIGLLGLTQIRQGLCNFLTLRRFLKQEPLDAVVFIDNPGLNLRLASVATKAGHRVIYYIAPQVWAWGKGRLQRIARIVHHMLVILPFEESLFREAGIPCTFVGHPLLDTPTPSYDQRTLREILGLPLGGPVLGLFPGSREHEVRLLLPTMVQAYQLMRATIPQLHGVIGLAPSLSKSLINELISDQIPLTVIPQRSNEVMAASDLLFIASGTATLQAALIGTPMVIVYRTAWLTYQIAIRLLQVPHIGLVNILAGQEIMPELLQHEVTAQRIRDEGLRILYDTQGSEATQLAFDTIRRQLGTAGASTRAAKIILTTCKP
ncbi:MAG: lipid-A-disaccharide synthase [Nitrospirales bacterium]|nr:lipid-A-disaccharide synthase [Nitrospirales bacterium]